MTDLTIGKAARAAGVGVETIRFYERRGLIEQPPRPAASGFRTYPDETVARIRFIRQAQELGFSLREAGELLALEALGDLERTELLRLVASAETPSEHPLARAVVDAAEQKVLSLGDAEDFQTTAGQGIEARVEGRAVLIGTPRFLEARGVDIASAEPSLAEHESQARTAVLVAIDGEVTGVLAIADAVKPDARDAIDELKRRSITPVLLTGDNERTAKAVAREVGIDEVYAQVVPEDKAARIRALQESGARVAMVGDGINDAPALMQAHVGIAIGAGTDIAIKSSDVVLIGEGLAAVPEAVTIGGMSYRKTVHNLWLAFFFNGVGVPTAATGILHPSWAMAAMAASVTLVLANSFGGRLLQPRRARLDAAAEKPATVASEQIQPPDTDRSIIFTVPDMHCQGCLETIRAGLAAEDGIGEVTGDLGTKRLHVLYRSDATGPQEIETAVTRLGYRVRTRETA